MTPIQREPNPRLRVHVFDVADELCGFLAPPQGLERVREMMADERIVRRKLVRFAQMRFGCRVMLALPQELTELYVTTHLG